MTAKNNRLASPKAGQPKRTKQEICDDANAAMLADPSGRRDVHWYVYQDQVTIGWRSDLTYPPSGDVGDRAGTPMSAVDTDKLNRHLESKGARARYNQDGSRYEIEPLAIDGSQC